MGTTTLTNISPHETPTAAVLANAVLRKPAWHVGVILGLWLTILVSSLAGSTLLDDADATHAQAAQAMISTGDWVTLHVDGIRYLEKAPLPYWIAAVSLRLFGAHPAFAIHLPMALSVLGLALLGYIWSRQVFGDTAALYTAVFLLTAAGSFLFTRVFIPDALLSLLLALSLYFFERALRTGSRRCALAMWAALALATLTKGLIAPVFIFTTAVVYLAVTRQAGRWRTLCPVTGGIVFLAIAAPWHVMAALRNTGSVGGYGFAPGHGFFWFYFVNEHLLRFLGHRIPRDYNKLPFALYWLLHAVWLFPWSLFAPAAAQTAWRRRYELLAPTPTARTVLLLGIFSIDVLCFFSLSTNQEYYTFPVYLPLLMLLAATVALPAASRHSDELSSFAFAGFTIVGLIVATALFSGLWSARALPFNADIGSALAHRGVGSYTLSMSHFFDLTDSSFAALRLPATLAALAFLLGPGIAWRLYVLEKRSAAVLTIACTSAVFLVAAQIAFLRFEPMLSSANFAYAIESLEASHRVGQNTEVLLFGDQAFGSSIPFYLHRRVSLVDGRSTSMLFGSTFPDAPPIFLSPQQLLDEWGSGPRHILFVPMELRDRADLLLGSRKILLLETSGKALFTDRPLEATNATKAIQ